jgi:hypothetical protein
MSSLLVGGVIVDLAGELLALFGGFSATLAAWRSSGTRPNPWHARIGARGAAETSRGRRNSDRRRGWTGRSLSATLTLMEASEEVARFALAIGLLVTGLGSAQIAIRIPSTAELAEMDGSEESTQREGAVEDWRRPSSPVR